MAIGGTMITNIVREVMGQMVGVGTSVVANRTIETTGDTVIIHMTSILPTHSARIMMGP